MRILRLGWQLAHHHEGGKTIFDGIYRLAHLYHANVRALREIVLGKPKPSYMQIIVP
jgi:hypothetical protein